MALIYKTLFEVKLMHEYYLTAEDGQTVFSFNNQGDRIDFLLQMFSAGRPSLNEDLTFEFAEEMKRIYDGFSLKLLMSYSGFKIACRVNQKILPDGTLVYTPFIPLPDDFNLLIRIVKKSPRLASYTLSDVGSPVAFNYLFSNENILSANVFPFLTSNISAFDATHNYTQGEIASYGINDIRQYYKDAGGDQWQSIPGRTYANENDRLLAPLRFYYTFGNTANITNAVFDLKDKDGAVLKTITVNNTDFINKAPLDFSDLTGRVLLPDNFDFEDAIFRLEVHGSNGFSKTHRVVFNNTLFSAENWGLIAMKSRVTNPLFNLFANDGYLFKRRLPNGTWNPSPVFEIPVKSRFPFFRFINDKGLELKLIPALSDYLLKEDKILLSKRPRSVAKNYFLLQKQGSSNTKYVPNPLIYDLKKDAKERLCFDVIVPESELFPIA